MTLGVSFQNGSYLNGGFTAGSYTSTGSIAISDFYNTEATDKKYEWEDNKEAHEIQREGRDGAVDTKVKNVITYIKKGQEDKAIVAYNELLDVMRSQDRYSCIAQNEAELRAIARQAIEASLEDESLEELIRKHTRKHSSVEQQNVLTWGNCDQTSQEALLLEMCDINEDETGGSWLVIAGAAIASPFVWLGNAIFCGGGKM